MLFEYKNNNILIVVAHPDDESLGCGGAIARHVDSGDRVSVVFLADGSSSRSDNVNTSKSAIYARMQLGIEACDILGVKNPQFLNLPDNKMDTVPFLDIVQSLERVIEKINPVIVYTHHAGDLNIDHKITHQAVMTACRPQPGCSVREIYSFEILSSTEWNSPSLGSYFIPNKFIDINSTLDRKLLSLEVYNNEMRVFPHSRSFKSVKALASHRGASMGMIAAEAFKVERILI